MKIIFADRFTVRQKEVIRVALMVAAANFELPKTIRIFRLPAEYVSEFDGDAGKGRIRIRASLHGASLFKTVSHEAVHVSQIHTGRLDSDPDHFYWNGKKVPARIRYENQPHEKEAFAYEKRLIPQ